MVTTRPRTATRMPARKATGSIWGLGLAVIVGSLGIIGCATRPAPVPPAPFTVDVPVPEPVYCSAQAPARPALPISALSESSSPADTIRAYAASVIILKGAVEQLARILAGCTRPPSASAPASGTDGRSIARAAFSR